MSNPQFRFAVLADTHVNPTDDQSNSPWQVNRLANERTHEVVRRVATENPEFVIHLGDMIHPVPGTPTYGDAARRFFELVSQLEPTLHLVAGNHDAGDKPVEWAPAHPITEDFLGDYESTFGASYYSFDHEDCHFIVLNTMLVNSGLGAETKQQYWLEQDLADHVQQKIFVFGHYPVFITRPDEPECYDNIGEPGRSWLLRLFEQYAVSVYFAGHVHNFFYNQWRGTEHYILPSTSFVRHDYSELARVPPDAQYGRDDPGKLGYLVVDVFSGHHVPHIVRNSEQPISEAGGAMDLRRGAAAPVGLDMRQHWAETVALPYNGMLDEFVRRTVRNDYPLMALWELGIQTIRIPLNDLADPELVARMRDLSAVGHRFHAFSYDIPTGPLAQALDQCADALAGVEIVLGGDGFARREQAIAELRASTGLPVAVSPLSTSAHGAADGARFVHQVKHGYDVRDGDIATLGADGVVFRVPADRPAWDDLRLADATARRLDVSATVHVTLTGQDPANDDTDDTGAACRVAETLLGAWSSAKVLALLDTLTDVDRGYYPRRGLLDRSFNLRPAGRVYRNLHTVLQSVDPGGGQGEAIDLPGGRICPAADGAVLLVLPNPAVAGDAVADAVSLPPTSTTIDLASGRWEYGVDHQRRRFTAPTVLATSERLVRR